MEAYQERLIKEYNELTLKIEKIRDVLKKYDLKELEFKLNCPISLLENQLIAMSSYKYYLGRRLIIELPEEYRKLNGINI